MDLTIFAESLIRLDHLVPWALFGAFAALAWWALDAFGSGKPRALERIDELARPGQTPQQYPTPKCAQRIGHDDQAPGKGQPRARQTLAAEKRSRTWQTQKQTGAGGFSERNGRKRLPWLQVRLAHRRTVSWRRHHHVVTRPRPEIADLDRRPCRSHVLSARCHRRPDRQRPEESNLSRPARRPRPDGRLRGGRIGP